MYYHVLLIEKPIEILLVHFLSVPLQIGYSQIAYMQSESTIDINIKTSFSFVQIHCFRNLYADSFFPKNSNRNNERISVLSMKPNMQNR